MNIGKNEAASLKARKRLGLGAAGNLILAAGFGLVGTGVMVAMVKAQTADTSGLSLGLEETAPAQPLAPVPAGYTFDNVMVEGNVKVDVPTIVAFLGLPKGEVVTDAALNDAYQRIVASGLFARVELVAGADGLLIKVVENPMIGTIDYQGNALIKDADLVTFTAEKAGQIYSPAGAEADAAIIAEAYRANGRMAATVTPRIIRRDNNTVDVVFEIVEGAVAEVARVSFVGNKDFSDYRLRQVLTTKQAGILHNLIQRDMFQIDRLEADKKMLTDFYLSRGYLDFQILDAGATYARDRDATFLTFTISEGQSFTVGNVTTISEVEGIDAAEYDKLRRLRSGVTYTPTIIQSNVESMESLALKQGLNFVTIEPRVTRNDRDGTVDVTFAIIKGPRIFVERIDIEGNTTTLDSVIRRQFRAVEGDPLNPREIAQAAERIKALGFFGDVQVDKMPGTGPDQDVVKVAVTEAPTGSLSLGASYGMSTGLGLNVGFSERNFLGRGQALTVNVQTGTENLDSKIAFVEPSFMARDLAFGFSAGYGRTTQQNSSYDKQVISVSPSLGFAVSDLGRMRVNYALSSEELSNVGGTTETDTSSEILQAESGSAIRSSVGYTYTWDDRNSGLRPKGGVMVQFGNEIAGLGGDVKVVQTTVRALAETKVLNGDATLRASFEGGAITSYDGYVTRVTDRYLSAGTMRGFEPNGIGPRDLNAANQDALGGNYFSAVHLEASFPLGLPEEYGISGGAFIEAGSVWGLNNTQGTDGNNPVGGQVDDSMHIRTVAGLSLFWTTPLGPLRFDFTRAGAKESYDLEQSFDFTIATKF
jgi:outer membrane protein insertion porin family